MFRYNYYTIIRKETVVTLWCELMEEKTFKALQIEALDELCNYLERLIPAIDSIIIELREEKQSDTDELLNTIINGLNWTIEVLNHTMEVINENETIVDKAIVNQYIQNLGVAIREHKNLSIAQIFETEIIPFLIVVINRAEVVTKR